MHYDVIIIGAGMSGLGAGIRLAYYDKRVCIVEQHNVYGGLNSFYTRDGRRFDVGLHALTNYVGRGVRQAPMTKMFRQLRLDRSVLELCEQNYSAVCFPDQTLRFDNDRNLLLEEVRRAFPHQIDGFRRLVEDLDAYDDLSYETASGTARGLLAEYLDEPLLLEMILCPLMFYGGYEPHDMDLTHFVTMFKSIYLQGMARPKLGVRRIIAELVKHYRSCGGTFRMGSAVAAIDHHQEQVRCVRLADGTELTGDVVISSAGYHETMALCGSLVEPPKPAEVGQLTFVESISILDRKPASVGLDATIIFFNDGERFDYDRPESLIDPRSGVVCCPNNYHDHDHLTDGVVRLTTLANYDRWTELPEEQYRTAKDHCFDTIADRAVKFIPEFRPYVEYQDMFTPRTIQQYTRHYNGAVYGAPRKQREGLTPLRNLFICGTDQGFLGIIGALMSGIAMANRHVLSRT